MLNAYEQLLAAFYLANAAAALHHRDREASDLAEWVADRENRVAFGRRKRPPSAIRAGAGTPTLWTMNSPRGVSETILRRMMFAFELRRPTPPVRARIWTRELARHGIEAKSEEVFALAREFEATPGVGAGATAAAGLAGGGIEAVRHGVRSLSRVLGCERPP